MYNNSHTVIQMLGSHLSCRTKRKSTSVLFAVSYWPAKHVPKYALTSFNIITSAISE